MVVTAPFSLEDKYTQDRGLVYASGVQALGRLLLAQRRRDLAAGLNTAGFVSGYRGSPLGSVDQTLWRIPDLLAEHHIKFQPGVNEDLAATAILGTQQIELFPGARYDGIFSLWYGKGPGVDRSGDPFHHGNMAGTSRHGGVLLAVGDDPVCHSSTVPQQSEFALMGSHIPVFNAGSVQDIYDFGLYGWALSRYSGLWIALKMVSDVAESSGTIDISPERTMIQLPQGIDHGETGLHLRWPDMPMPQQERLFKYRIPALHAFVRANSLNTLVFGKRQRLGIITAGKSYFDLRQALLDLGITEAVAKDIGLSIYKVAITTPLEVDGIHQYAAGLEQVMVVEEGRSVMEPQIKDHLYNLPGNQRPILVGKRNADGEIQFGSDGELSVADIARTIAKWLAPYHSSDTMTQRLAQLDQSQIRLQANPPKFIRTPYFCSGCPHSTGTRVPEGSQALGGIGCHFMALHMDRNTSTFTHMGAEGATWAGLAHFTDLSHLFVNLGDGTYYHSGLLAIRQAVASGVNITYKILYNDAAAMTGGQPVDGPLSVAMITRQVGAEGVKRIAVVSDMPEKFNTDEFEPGTTLNHRDDLDKVQKELREVRGTSLLIYEQTCGSEKRRRRKRGKMIDPPKRVFINERVCEGCGDCGVQSNCLSVAPVETEFGRKRTIEQSSCNKDYSCVKGFCPSFVTVHGGDLVKKTTSAKTTDLFSTLPPATIAGSSEAYPILVAGIGGMGVITISALLGIAAHIEGKTCKVLDLTGLAQKFGAVYSHVQIADNQQALTSARIANGNAKLLLGPDLVTSASTQVLTCISQGTRAVINTQETMTGAFTKDPGLRLPADDLKKAIRDFCDSDNVEFIDASRLAQELMGDSVGASIMMMGYASQKGWMPVSTDALEQAIRLNGVAIEDNLKVFNWGRLLAHAPDQVQAIVGEITLPVSKPVELEYDDLVKRRSDDLLDYQNQALAERYLTLIKKVEAAEKQSTQGRTGLAMAVAKNFYTLLAYKDEYEVARLFTNGEFDTSCKKIFQGDYTLRFHMAPPLLAKKDKETGRLKKKEYGPWMFIALKQLAKLRFLRGTKLDIFGYSAERKREISLIKQYEHNLEEILQGLNQENHAMAIEIASLPEIIRGYGHIKERNMDAADVRREALLRSWRTPKVERKVA